MRSPIAQVGIFLKQNDKQVISTLATVAQVLIDHNIDTFIESKSKAQYQSDLPGYSAEEIGRQCDMAIVIGGDGTLLHAARLLAPFGTPITGINLGRLGFLVDVSPDEIQLRLNEFLMGEYVSEPRFLLEIQLQNHSQIKAPLLALNDLVFHKWELARMIEFETSIDGHSINAYRADGLVIATPTGSTAYALSAGGPLIHPSLKAIAVVPICPHTLNNRPLIVNADSEITLSPKEEDARHTMITLDGQTRIQLESATEIRIRCYPRLVNLLHPVNYDYFDILRAKLRWGSQSLI